MTAPAWSIDDVGGLSTATAHEAAGRIGALPSAIKPVAPHMRLAGPAFPVVSPAGDNLFLHHAIYAAELGEILIADCSGGREFGYWGEVMATAAAARGLGGLVLTGGVRDSQALAALGFPVFSATVCIRGTMKNPHGAGSLGAPIRVGKVDIRRGDLILGDADGVLAIPAPQVRTVAANSRRRDAEEVSILARLRAGETTIAIYNLPAIAAIA